MILCVTPNPAIDRTLVVPRFMPGEVHRVTQTVVAAGGKGLNAARAIRTLGGTPLCLGFLGGLAGRGVADLAEQEGLPAVWTPIENETRTCLIIVPDAGGEPTVLNEPGPAVASGDWERLAADIKRVAGGPRQICFCGSLPGGASVEAFAGLLQDLIQAKYHVWLDTSGPALAAAARLQGINIKVNGLEAGVLLKQDVDSIDSALQAARVLRREGAGRVVITLGRLGAVLLTDEGGWHGEPASVKAVSNVGSGDSFLGGLLTALAEGRPKAEALRWAVAAGAANTLTIGGGKFSLSDFQKLLNETAVTPLTSID
jgi:1-phosphofructokinase family hexose kinase